MDIIIDLRAILISASFVSPYVYTRLQAPALSTRHIVSSFTASLGTLSPSHAVETCSCPFGYTGHSCEECLAGYYRVDKTCVKCECNLHSKMCERGVCIDCKDHTTGPHCDQCKHGFYGDPTSGLKNACTKCPCPKDGHCKLDSVGNVECVQCEPYVTGKLCDRCVKGYYGHPELGCKKCECNNNLDMSHNVPCNQTTGQCLHCKEGMTGQHCDQCSMDYWSRSKPKTNCQQCECSYEGRQLVPCNADTGQCLCKPGFSGKKCDQCVQHFTWGTQPECKECNCDVEGSLIQHCNSTTGECYCKRHHTGRKCDKCQLGYFRSSGGPCTECKCDNLGATTSTCNTNGRCTCNPGYTGRDCSLCDRGFYANSSHGCSECDDCSQYLVTSLFNSQTKMKSIRTISQDYFIGKVMKKLKKMKNKCNLMMKNLSTRITALGTLDKIIIDTKSIIFSDSKRQPSMPRKADKLLFKAVKSSSRLMTVAGRLDYVLEKRKMYWVDAYKNYDYAQKLSKKMENLEVPTTEIRAIEKQIKIMQDNPIKKVIKQNTKYINSLETLEIALEKRKHYVKTFKSQVNVYGDKVADTRDRIRKVATSLAENKVTDLDKTDVLQVFEEAKNEHIAVVYLEEKFINWTARLWDNVAAISTQINNTQKAVSVENVTHLLSEVEMLYTSVLTLPTLYTVPTPLSSTPCSRTFKFVSSVYGLLTKSYYATLVPINQIRRIRHIIQHINTITQYQKLEMKYFNTKKLTKKIKILSTKAKNRKLSKLNNELHLCNHRLKKEENQIRIQRNRLGSVKQQIKTLVYRYRGDKESENPEINETFVKLNSLKDGLDNLTLKKKKFSSLEEDVDRRLNRMNEQIQSLKIKGLAFETIKFSRKDWVLYKMGRETKEISFVFRSDKGSGNILSIQDQSGVEGVMVSLDRNVLTVKCSTEEWWNSASHFDSSHFSTIYIYIKLGEIAVRAYQYNKMFYSQEVPCVLEPKNLILGRKSSLISGWVDQGFSGCVTQLFINKKPRVIRQADKISGQLLKCAEHNNVEKSVADAACGNGYLSLSTETQLKPTPNTPAKFEVLVNKSHDKTVILSLGPLKMSGKKGHITVACSNPEKLVFRDVYEDSNSFIFTIELFGNYVSVSVGDSPRSLPCTIRDSQYILGNNESGPKGCIRTFL